MVLAMMPVVGIPASQVVAAVCPGGPRPVIAQTVAGVVARRVVLGLVVSVIPVVVPTATAGGDPLAFLAIWRWRRRGS